MCWKLKLELEPYGLKFTDGVLQDDGALLWSINHANGFSSAVFFDQDEGYGLIDVYSYPTEDEEWSLRIEAFFSNTIKI